MDTEKLKICGWKGMNEIQAIKENNKRRLTKLIIENNKSIKDGYRRIAELRKVLEEK